MKPLSPSQKNVLRVRGLLAAVVVLVPAIIVDTAFIGDAAIPFGLVTGAAVLVALFLVFVAPGRRYASWRYDTTEDELNIENGILIRNRTVVPFGRVQHIDVSQGPVERHFGVGAITLHTAGTRNSAVVLPGLDHAEAGRMRDEIRGKIRQDLA